MMGTSIKNISVFPLRKVRINYLTGELQARRQKSYLGINVMRAEDLPDTGRRGSLHECGMSMCIYIYSYIIIYIEWANALVPPTPPLRGGEAGVGGESHTYIAQLTGAMTI